MNGAVVVVGTGRILRNDSFTLAFPVYYLLLYMQATWFTLTQSG